MTIHKNKSWGYKTNKNLQRSNSGGWIQKGATPKSTQYLIIDSHLTLSVTSKFVSYILIFIINVYV